MEEYLSELEKIYTNNLPGNHYIEQDILESFSKKELKEFIHSNQIEYFEAKSSYLKDLKKVKKEDNFINLATFEKYFIEQIQYYFNGGFELNLNYKFLEKINNYYKWKYSIKNNTKTKWIDFNSIPITEFISRFIKKPGNYKTKNFICPFPDHREKTGSFKIYEKDNKFKCFGCGRYGNAVNFIEYFYGMEKKEACKKVINLYK